MTRSKLLTLFLILWVVLVATASYFMNGPQFSSWYGSDQAIHVLMANDFSWPRDLYYWRQDRLGSAVPLLGHVLHKVGFSTIVAVGMAKFLFLLTGWVLGSRYLQNNVSKVVLAIVWFFPLSTFHFWTGLGHPYAEHLTFVLAAWAMTDYCFKNHRKQNSFRHLEVFVVTLLWILALWVSDLTIVLLPVIVLELWLRYRGSLSDFNINRLKDSRLITIGLTLVAGAWFLLHAKRAAFRIDEYHQLIARPNQLVEMWRMIVERNFSYLNFSRSNPYISIAAWGMLIIWSTAFFSILRRLNRIKTRQLVLFAGAVFMFAAIFLSSWSNTPDPSYRHYTGIIPLVWIIVLMEMETFRIAWRRPAVVIVLLTVVSTVGSSVHRYKDRIGDSPYQRATEVRRLGKANIIGNYWRSYLYASVSPDSIMATAPELNTVRRVGQAYRLVREPSVYIIKEDWVDRWPSHMKANWYQGFPDTIVQFGRLLVIDGEPFRLVNSTFCNYKTLPITTREKRHSDSN